MTTIDPNHIRDLVHNLDLNNPEHNKIFWDVTRTLLIKHEGLEYEAYDDHPDRHAKKISTLDNIGKPIKGNVTIRVGFNMEL
jgi:hypothetical protein